MRMTAGIVIVVGTWLAPCAPAGAQTRGSQSADRWVTIAARECDDYSDIRANLARNNIMESLEDLGDDTLYQSGDPIDPRTELEGQPNCRPIVDWRLTFGTSYRSRAVSGLWGALSIVTDPDGGNVPVTKADVPARDFDGHPVQGGVKIQGAVTIGLNRDQVDRADQNRLWLQGGTPEDPMLYADPQFAGRYGFGALRCAIDDLNGDNVETIQFPAGTRHMYCFAYYVTPPPSSGTIIIRKQVDGSEASESFRFTGNVSYNEGGAFDLSASQGDPPSTEFLRGETRPGDAPWTVVESANEGWTLTGIQCTSQTSATTTSVPARTVEISLVAGDTVTCTFINRLTPPAGALVLRKVTRNGVGTFPFRVRDEDGDVVARRDLTTGAAGGVGAVRAIKLDPGRYEISERRPVTRQGTWQLAGVRCNGSRRPRGEPVVVNITAGRGAVCTFTNRLDRLGRITIDTVTLGGLGTAWYMIAPAGNPRAAVHQSATTRRQGTPEDASGQPTNRLPFGRYVLLESAGSAGERNVWSLIAVTCNGRLVPFEQGRVTVTVTPDAPRQDCRFINLRQRVPGPPPPDPSEPDPAEPTEPTDPGALGPDPVPGEGTPDLALTKRLTDSTGGELPTLTFRLRVTNRSAVTATRVVVADRLAAGTAFVSADPSQGRCVMRGARLLVCTLGDLAPGEHASIRVRVQHVDPGAGVNVAVVGAGSPEDVLRNNVAAARIAALQPRPPGACPALSRPVARSAC